MSKSPILSVRPLGHPWETFDPFLFCVHHNDAYPAGNAQMGPAASLVGRRIGMDFEGRDGWSMYHGESVPGFPAHPHRGFETVTLARRGFIDHSDSLGAAARFGHGDVQWMTAGRGVVHAEMFPLVNADRPNPTELFQIWLNLPSRSKLVAPHFSMLWAHQIPHRIFTDVAGRQTEVVVVAGQLGEAAAPSPPPSSWAADPANAVAIWTLAMEPGAQWTLPAAPEGCNRALYLFVGEAVRIADKAVAPGFGVRLVADAAVELTNGAAPAELLLLQGRPIAEPVAQYGPFVMNTTQEIHQAVLDYRRTEFGGWPWPSPAPVHPRAEGRFALHADGRRERPEG